MEAGNRGAKSQNGKSVGLNIDLPHEQFSNIYIDPDKLISFDYFFVRKVMFVKYAQGFIVMPGGFGTMDEMFEAMRAAMPNDSSLTPQQMAQLREMMSGKNQLQARAMFERMQQMLAQAGHEHEFQLWPQREDANDQNGQGRGDQNNAEPGLRFLVTLRE